MKKNKKPPKKARSEHLHVTRRLLTAPAVLPASAPTPLAHWELQHRRGRNGRPEARSGCPQPKAPADLQKNGQVETRRYDLLLFFNGEFEKYTRIYIYIYIYIIILGSCPRALKTLRRYSHFGCLGGFWRMNSMKFQPCFFSLAHCFAAHQLVYHMDKKMWPPQLGHDNRLLVYALEKPTAAEHLLFLPGC